MGPIYHTAESIAFVQDLNDQAVALGYSPFDNGYRGSGYEASSIYDLEPGMAAQDWHYRITVLVDLEMQDQQQN